jgi:hypothetical protein
MQKLFFASKSQSKSTKISLDKSMKVGIFYSSITNIERAPHKQLLMDIFKEGVQKHGDVIKEYKSTKQVIDHLDAGFVLGYALKKEYRRTIIDTLKLMKSKIIFVDSNIFTYNNPIHQYHRYSVNGVYPTDGEYFLGEDRNPEKLEKVLNAHHITVKPWRETGEHILILGQRTLSWNMLNTNGLDWIISMIGRLKECSNRKIIVRLHPGDTNHNIENRKRILRLFGTDNVSVSTNGNIKADLRNAWCSVGYNSTPNCVSVFEGIPVYLDNSLNSWAKEMAFTDLTQLEDPPLPDRTAWLHKIAHIHWSNEEISSGKYWERFKNFYKS